MYISFNSWLLPGKISSAQFSAKMYSLFIQLESLALA
jgi:hypothetical protein